jgi:hypothetical protein
MAERFLLALLSGLVGLLVGLLAPGVIPGAQDIAAAEQAWLNPIQATPAPTAILALPRASAVQTAVPPTLQAAPTASRPSTPTPEAATPPEQVTARTFVIRLAGGGEMKVVANDEAAARNNVRSTGATPAN